MIADSNPLTAYGTLGTPIPTGSIASVDGDTDTRFITTGDFTIGAGTDEVQDIDFSAVPDAGSWTLIFDGEETTTLAFSDAAAAVESALNGLPNLSAVTVSGNYTAGFTVTFSGADGSQDQLLLQAGVNTLTASSIQVNLNFAETTKGILPNVEMDVEAVTAGNIPAAAGTITVIETPVAGWDSVTNLADITPGRDIESDAALRLRREETLSTAGAATVDAIRAALLEIDEVTTARVFENDSMVVNGFGRPPKSIEPVVLGGDTVEIAQTIWDTKAGGIETYGAITETAYDDSGFPHDVSFSRPTEIPIYVIVNITTDDDFPVGGEDSIKEAIVAYALTNFLIGDDVIQHKLICPTDAIDGIVTIEILIGLAPAPTLEDNIAIAEDDVAKFDTSTITVNIL